MIQHKKIILAIVVVLILAALFIILRPKNTGSLTPTNTSSTTSTSAAAHKEPLASSPNRDIFSNTLDGADVTTFVIALQASGLADALQGKDAYTVFAPSNAAFAKLEDGVVDSLLRTPNQSKLTTLLKNHIVKGTYTSSDLSDGQTLKALSGKSLTIKKRAGGTITINGSANVTTKDVLSNNGVTYVIDSVITTK